MNQILPGGKYNKVYTAYLDMIADYAKQVKSAVLFRPFHENTGSWFWWGAAFCDPETYKNIFRYTVEYLRDTKNVHYKPKFHHVYTIPSFHIMLNFFYFTSSIYTIKSRLRQGVRGDGRGSKPV